MIRPSVRHALVVVIVLALAPAALAQTELNERRSARPDGLVEVSNIAGSIEVSTWSKSEVEVTGTLGRGSEELHFEVNGNRTEIEVRLPEGRNNNVDGSDLVIHVPEGSSLEIAGVSADITVESGGPRVEAQSVSGDVRVSGGAVALSVQSVSGDVDVVGSPDTERVEAQSVSGNVRYAGGLSGDGRIEAQTVSGDVTVKLPAGFQARFEAQTFSGTDKNQLSNDKPESGGFIPTGGSLEFSTGGGARIEAQSFSGRVALLVDDGLGSGASRATEPKRKRYTRH